MNCVLRLLLAAILALATSTAFAATQYVTDQLRISVRTGAGNQYRIVEVVPSGTRLQTLQTSGEWSQVRTPKGETGWVRAQYLTGERIAADQLDSAQKNLDQAREQVDTLKQDLAEARSSNETAGDRVNKLIAKNEKLQSRLQQAERGLKLSDENQRLESRIDTLEDQKKQLQQETAQLHDRTRREWFLIGAGVLLGGLLLGMIVTRIPWRRKRDRMF